MTLYWYISFMDHFTEFHFGPATNTDKLRNVIEVTLLFIL